MITQLRDDFFNEFKKGSSMEEEKLKTILKELEQTDPNIDDWISNNLPQIIRNLYAPPIDHLGILPRLLNGRRITQINLDESVNILLHKKEVSPNSFSYERGTKIIKELLADRRTLSGTIQNRAIEYAVNIVELDLLKTLLKQSTISDKHTNFYVKNLSQINFISDAHQISYLNRAAMIHLLLNGKEIFQSTLDSSIDDIIDRITIEKISGPELDMAADVICELISHGKKPSQDVQDKAIEFATNYHQSHLLEMLKQL